MVGHTLQRRPWHHLEKISIEGWHETVGRITRGHAIRMNMIEVGSLSHDLNELGKGTTPFRQSGFVGRQIARDDVRQTRDQCKVLATTQVVLGIDLCRSLAQALCSEPFRR